MRHRVRHHRTQDRKLSLQPHTAPAPSRRRCPLSRLALPDAAAWRLSMSDNASKPVVFLAFANDRVEGARYLRALPDEARRLREHRTMISRALT